MLVRCTIEPATQSWFPESKKIEIAIALIVRLIKDEENTSKSIEFE